MSSPPAAPGAPGASAAQALQFSPSAPAAPEAPAGAMPELPVALLPKTFTDPQTGQIIPHATILANLEILDKTKEMFEECSRIYHQVLKQAPGSWDNKRAIAKRRSETFAGGSHTAIWDRLAQDKVVVSMVVTGPPAYDNKEAKSNEVKLKCMIWKVDKYLRAELSDMWTSVQEIGSLSQTYIYCRFPYHLATQVHRLAVCLSTLEAHGTHKFSAKVVFEGRHQPKKWQVTPIEPWELSMARSFQV